ncbi:MAG: CRISPR-associated endonuclease Cas1 [Thiolinea sp.]
MRSPLFLDVSVANSVALDGVALRVVTHERVDVWYPLRRLARVVVTGRVEWETRALLACLEAGVPVAFRRRDGTLIGHCLSDVSSRVSLEALLVSAVQLPEGEQIYQRWLVECWQDWLARAALVLGDEDGKLAARDAEARIVLALPGLLPCEVSLFRRQMQALSASQLTGVLLGFGFSDNVHVPLTPLVHPLRDLGRLLEWDLLLRVVSGARVRLDAERGLRFSLVRFFQQCDPAQEKQVRAYLNRLWRLLKEDEVD